MILLSIEDEKLQEERTRYKLQRTAYDWWWGNTSEQRTELTQTYFPQYESQSYKLTLEDVTELYYRVKIMEASQSWLKSMTPGQWGKTVCDWKKLTKDSTRQDWSPEKIATSTIAVERVYREMVLGEFK